MYSKNDLNWFKYLLREELIDYNALFIMLFFDYNRCHGRHKKDFSDNSSGAYTCALKGGFLNDICKHMTPKPRIK